MTPLRFAAVVGDIHAQHEALRAALTFCCGHRPDAILAVGDVVDELGNVDECVRLLIHAEVHAVSGNHDRWFLEGSMRDWNNATPLDAISRATRDYLMTLPPTRTFETTTGALLLCHGLGANDMGKLKPDDVGYAIEANTDLQDLLAAGKHRYVINGHTHHRMARTFGQLACVNAGTLLPYNEPCVATVDFVARIAQFHDLTDALGIQLGMTVALP